MADIDKGLGDALRRVDSNTTRMAVDIEDATGVSITATNASVSATAAAVPASATMVGGTDGTNLRALKTTTGGVVQVDLSQTAANSTAVKVDGSAVSQPCVGDVAHDGVDSGNPVKIGMKAYTFDGTTPQAAVSAEGDRVNAIADLQGIAYVQTAHPAFFSATADYSGAQTNASVKAAPGAGSIFLTDIFISNGATAGKVTLLDGSGGSVIFTCYPGINGGAVFNSKNPIKLSATTALCITSTTVTTHSVTVCGFIA
jgi:hypothetical protein